MRIFLIFINVCLKTGLRKIYILDSLKKCCAVKYKILLIKIIFQI